MPEQKYQTPPQKPSTWNHQRLRRTLVASVLTQACCLESPIAEEPRPHQQTHEEVELATQALDTEITGTTTQTGGAPSTSTKMSTSMPSSDTSAGGAASATTERPIARNVEFSELKIDPPGTDGNNEFIELKGSPNEQLAGYFLVEIEGDSESNLGQVDKVFDFSNCGSAPCSFGENGILLLIAAEGAVPSLDSSTKLAIFGGLVRGGLENGTATIGLYFGGKIPKVGDDWDTNDDGILEPPMDSVSYDAVSWTDGDLGDRPYTEIVVGPKPLAHAIVRCNDNSGTLPFRFGQLTLDATSLAFDTAHLVPADLSESHLTPGAPNDCRAPAAKPNIGEAGGAPSRESTLAERNDSSPVGASPSSSNPSNAESSGALEETAGVAASPGNTASELSDTSSSLPLADGGAGTAAASAPSWWSPSPFGGRSNQGGRNSAAPAQGGSSAGRSSFDDDATNPPDMPGGCHLVSSPHQRREGLTIPLLGLVFSALRRQIGVRTRKSVLAGSERQKTPLA